MGTDTVLIVGTRREPGWRSVLVAREGPAWHHRPRFLRGHGLATGRRAAERRL